MIEKRKEKKEEQAKLETYKNKNNFDSYNFTRTRTDHVLMSRVR
jgi:hypothetical protein